MHEIKEPNRYLKSSDIGKYAKIRTFRYRKVTEKNIYLKNTECG